MRNVFITTVAAMAISTAAFAEDTVTKVTPMVAEPVISGKVEMKFSQDTTTDKWGGAMAVDLGIDAGDMATVEADGSLTLLGRGSQVINSAGEKIFPEEVEEAVKRVDVVLDCLVVGIDDEKFGQAVTAVASLSPGAKVEEATVIAKVKTQLAGYKAPKRVVFVTQIPRAPNGKADYKTARDMAIAGLA